MPHIQQTGTTRLIWAYNDRDPPSLTSIPIHQKMGSRSLNIFERQPEADKPALPSDVQTYDCRVPNVIDKLIIIIYMYFSLFLRIMDHLLKV